MLRIFLFTILLYCCISSAPNYIFPPIAGTEDYVEKVIIFIPGGGVPIQFYNLTVQTIQMHTKAKLWVGVPNFHNTKDLCNPLDQGPWGLKQKVQATLTEIQSQSGKTYENSDIFIFGHSLGTACSQIYFNKGYAGFALFGGCIPMAVGFDKVEEPTMCFTGELDLGMVPTLMSYMFDAFDEMAETMGSVEQALTHRPVGLAPHMCHLDVSPGYVNVGSHFTSELTMEESLHIIGEVSSSFLQIQINGKTNEDIQTLKKYYDLGNDLLRPYRELAKIQNSTWCGEYAQKTIANLDDNTWNKVNLEQHFLTVDDPFSIEHCHTACNLTDSGNLFVNVSSMAEYNTGRSSEVSQGVGTMSLSAADLACKMVSRDKFGQVLGTPMDNDKTCKDVNQLAIDTAFDYLQTTTSSTTYQRFKNIGKQFKLIDDKLITIGPAWCVSKAGFKVKSDEVEVQSIALLSPITSSIYPGNHYCKLLSPVRVVEWAMARGLPHNISSLTTYKIEEQRLHIKQSKLLN